MTKPNLAIPINPDLGTQAQSVFSDMGLDITTVVDYFLRQVVHNKGTIHFEAVSVNFTDVTPPVSPSQLVETNETKEEILLRLYASSGDSFVDISKVKGKPAKLGGWEGKAWISDDFNAPLDDFEEYM